MFKLLDNEQGIKRRMVLVVIFSIFKFCFVVVAIFDLVHDEEVIFPFLNC